MSKTLYLECYAGISGDMTVAALLDLGASQTVLEEALKSLPLTGFTIEISRVKKAGLDACNFCVHLDKEHENHDHDMKYLHGNGEHHHEKEEHHHVHRGLTEIRDIIKTSQISENSKEIAGRIFTILAKSEAKAHGVPPEEVHFHEVGAVDSIVDIVAIAVCVDNLGITKTAVSDLYEGRGFIRCQHGMIPVPVPAVTGIVGAHGLTLHLTQTEGELVTPTGAATAAALRNAELPVRFQIEKVGIGAGKRTYDRPSILRAMLIQEEGKPTDKMQGDSIWKLESNIDDCSSEALGFAMEELLRNGARDVHYLPVYMKKNRPAYQLNVICDEENIFKMEELIFRHTTTIGIRRQKMERTILHREMRSVMTSLGEAAIKLCEMPQGMRIYPEYESVAKLCRESGFSFQEVYLQIVKECENYLK